MHYESLENSGTDDFMLGMITNSNSVGGFEGITGRDVTLNDGVFEVTLIRMPPMLVVEWPGILTALMNGSENKNVITFKTSRLELWFDQPVSWTKDGEYGGDHSHLVIENIPQALPILIPDRERDNIFSAQRKDSAELNESLKNLSILIAGIGMQGAWNSMAIPESKKLPDGVFCPVLNICYFFP